MNTRLIGLLLALSAFFSSFAHAEENMFTPTHGRTCTDRSRAEISSLRCAGPNGYVAEYGDEGNVVAVAIWMPSRTRKADRAIIWRGTGRVFGEKLQWRLHGGGPVAAILRIWRLDVTSGGQEREVSELIVLKIAPAGSCRVASVDTRQAGANEIALTLLSQVGSLTCLEDQ
jgi:hypothetical protein